MDPASLSTTVLIGQADALFSKTCSKHIASKASTQEWFETRLTPVALLCREGTPKKTYSVKDKTHPRRTERQMGLLDELKIHVI